MNNKKIAFLYAGQGSQKIGMGKDFYDSFVEFRNILDSIDDSENVKKYMFEGPIEELSDTKNTQRAMAVFACGITNLLKKEGIVPDVALGLSLGEYGALYAADAYTSKEYIDLLTYRGKVMKEASDGKECAMSAILGLDSSDIKRLTDEYMKEQDVTNGNNYISVSNYNCYGQSVICGDAEAVSIVEKRAQDLGAKRCIRLNVSGPFHTAFMKEAGDKLKNYLDNIPLKELKNDVFSNRTGDYYHTNDDIKKLLVEQIQKSVKLEDNIERLLERDVDICIEIGPGKVVSGFVKKMAKHLGKNIEVLSIDTVDDYKKVINQCKVNSN